MKRAIVLALSVILALAVAAPTVLAQEDSPNGVPPVDVFPPSFTLDAKDPDALPTDPASLGCNFPLRFDLTGKGKGIELPDGGFILTSPGLYVTVTNLDTPENQVTFNITGSIHGTPRPDDSGIVDYVITGRNLALDPAGVFLNIGRFTYSLRHDEEGNVIEIVTPQQGKGQAIDVCELLS